MITRLSQITFLLVLAVALIACNRSGGNNGALIYSAPTEKKVNVGEFLPGTGVQYIGPVEEKGAELRIDGLLAYKKVADSVDWQGAPLPGVNLEIAQRVLLYNADSLRLGGRVTIAVENANPEALPARPLAPVEYAIPVTYNVQVGAEVPGTRLLIKDIDPDRGVEFSGWTADQFPFRKVADSVQWDGRLRDGVALSLTLRVAWIRDNTVQLAGVADLLLTP